MAQDTQKAGAHPSQAALLDYSLGRLPEPVIDQIGSHLEACPPCQDTLCDLELHQDTYVEALRAGSDLDEAMGAELSSEAIRRIARLAAEASQQGEEPLTNQLGPYLLRKKIGEGGMGEVYLAEHTKLGRHVALKLLPQRGADSPERIERFEREMRAVGGMHHENIVQAYDAGEHNGQRFLSMELLDGIDLARLVRHEGVLPIADACEAIHQAALGLAHAHEKGLVHRDIKPSNLMLTKSGTVKLLDLGLAGPSLLTSAAAATPIPADVRNEGDPRLTRAGQLLGTPDFMSPEQCVAAEQVDARSDLYSLGATLYFLLSSRAPFAGRVYDTLGKKLDAIANREVPPITDRRPDLDPGLAAVVGHLLAKDRASRFASAEQVARVLQPFTAGSQLERLAGGVEPDASPLPRTRDDAAPAGVAKTAAAAPRPATGGRPPYVKWLVAAAAGAAAFVVWMVMTIQTPDGTLVIEAPDDAANSLRVTVSRGDDEVTTSAEEGWSLTLEQGDWRIDLSDPTGEYDLDRAEVTIQSAEQQIVRLARRKITPDPPEPPEPPTPPVVRPAVPPVAFEVAHPMSAEWDFQCDLFTKAYRLDEDGRTTIDGLTALVGDRYVAELGKTTLIDERIRLTLSDPARGFWPVIIYMTPEAAESLHRSLTKAVEANAERHGESAAVDDRGIVAVLSTADQKMESEGRVPLPKTVSVFAEPELRQGEEMVRAVPTLTIRDPNANSSPLKISLPVPAIENLQRELAQAIRRKNAARRQQVTLQTVGGYYVGARNGGGGAVTALEERPGSSEVFTLEWLDTQRLKGRLRTRDGHYVHAELGGGSDLDAEPKEPGTSEAFDFEWLDLDRTKARIRTRNKHYLRAAAGGGGDVDARAARPDPTTVFRVGSARQ